MSCSKKKATFWPQFHASRMDYVYYLSSLSVLKKSLKEFRDTQAMTKFSYAHFHKIPKKLFMSSKIDVFMENFAKTLKKVFFCRNFIENGPFSSLIKKWSSRLF